jgi:uncharacterized protein (TIGR02453 family)
MPAVIEKSTLLFLKNLEKNNNRDWFNEHKGDYEKAHTNMIHFCDAVLIEMRKHDNIETASGKECLLRIYRDTRFSKDKIPYKTYFAGRFKRATKKLRGGYYFEVGPGCSFAAGGFFSPEKDDLLLIRKDIEGNYDDWQKLLGTKTIKNTFGQLQGDALTSVPRGFEKDHPGIELLRHKNFYLQHDFTNKEVLEPSFAKALAQTFKSLRPFFDHMSEVLTSDANGVSLL